MPIIIVAILALLLSCSGNFEPIPYENRASAEQSSSSSVTVSSSSSSIASSSSSNSTSSSSSVASSSSTEQSSSSLGCTIDDDKKDTHYCSNGEKKEYGKIYISHNGNTLTYKTVEIGPQIWMAENLKNSVPYSQSYDNYSSYGRLYNWTHVNNNNLCNDSFHLPNETDWRRLINFVSNGRNKDAGKKLKAKDWGGTDDYGFSALPGGIGNSLGNSDYNFQGGGIEGNWWVANSGVTNNQALKLAMYDNTDSTEFKNTYQVNVLSVRCVKDK